MAHAFASHAISNVYGDLALAEEYLRLQRSWLPHATFVQLGVLSRDVQRGHNLELNRCSGVVSYLDLAAGMIEIAQSGDYDWKGVAVNATSQEIKSPWDAPGHILRGILLHNVPGVRWVLGKVGLL